MVFYEFTSLISCILFRFHAKIRQRLLSFNFWINASFATFSLYGKFWSAHRTEKGTMVLSRASSVNEVHYHIC